MFSYVSAEQRIPKNHPLRAIRALVDEVLADTSREFDRLYSTTGRPSIPPERLLRAQLLQIFYSIRSELFRRVVERAQGLTSDEHFTVDGTAGRGVGQSEEFSTKGWEI
jgi:transposase-like protein DUF772